MNTFGLTACRGDSWRDTVQTLPMIFLYHTCGGTNGARHAANDLPGRGCQVKCVTFSHLYPLPKQYHELIQGRFPLRNRLRPLFGHMLQTHVQYFDDRLVIGECTTTFP